MPKQPTLLEELMGLDLKLSKQKDYKTGYFRWTLKEQAAQEILELLERRLPEEQDFDQLSDFKIVVPANTKLHLASAVAGYNQCLSEVKHIIKGADE